MEILDRHYPNPEIPLNYLNPYTFLIAVLLSAQCTDARVNLVTPALFAKAPSPEKMLLLSPEEIETLIRPCGLAKKKSKAIWELSHLLIDRHEGNVPKNLKELEALPGVGHKTASVVISQIFNEPAFPVDTHIHRCAKRWGISSGKNVIQTERDLKAYFPKSTWNKLHLQMIYFARAFCPALRHDASSCPICSQLKRS